MNYQLLFRYDAAAGEGGGGTGAGAGEGGGAGAGAGSGAGGAEPTITLTEKELTARQTRHHQNGMSEAEKRILEKQIPELFKKHNITYGKTLEETLASIGETLTSSKKDTDQRIIDSQVKIETLDKEKNQLMQALADKDYEVTNFIINGNLIQAIGGKSVNPAIATTLLREDYKIDRLKDGTISVQDKSGNVLYDTKGDRITLEGLVDKFLIDHPYLAKTSNTGGTGGADRTTSGSGNLDALAKKAKNDPSSLTDDERKILYAGMQ